MPSSSAVRSRLPKFAAGWPWRRVGVLAGVSFVLSFALIVYLFGFSDQFFTRLFSAFFVLLWLLAVTFLAVVPFVTWATSHWFGRGWDEVSSAPTGRIRRPASSSAAPVRKLSSHAAARRPETL